MNAGDLAEHAGITYRQVDSWVRSGYLRPVGGVGTGHLREFPSDEVIAAVRMGRLVKAGLSARVAARVARGEQGPVEALRKALEAAG